jgi:uncharacterized membrane protein YeaQ/YmgE (transglycosylase-associated protein family)
MLGAIVIGLVGGAMARLLLPRDAFRSMSGPASWLVSFGIGLAGAVVGWLVFGAWLGLGDGDVFDLEGIVGAMIGTLVLLPLAAWLLRRRSG